MSKVTQHKKSRTKPRPRPKTPRRQKMPALRPEDLPNPGVVAALTEAAKEAADGLPDRSGLETLRELAPGSLLMMAARQAQQLGVPMTMQIEDGEPFVVRPIDIEAAGMGMMARAMGTLANKLLTKVLEKEPLKLFEGPQLKKIKPKE